MFNYILEEIESRVTRDGDVQRSRYTRVKTKYQKVETRRRKGKDECGILNVGEKIKWEQEARNEEEAKRLEGARREEKRRNCVYRKKISVKSKLLYLN